MASNNIASAFVELRGDFSKFAGDVSTGIEKALAGVNADADKAGEQIEAAFKEAAAQADVALGTIGGADVFGDLGAGAQRAGEQIEGAMKEAASQSDAHLDSIGGADVWSDVTAEAERAGEKIEGSMKEAARQSEAHLRGIDANVGGGMLSKAGVAMAGFGYLGGVALKSVITNASDLGESINAVNVTFGDAAAGITQLGEEAATSVGLSQSQFNGLAVQFSSFATTIAGEGGDVVGTMDDMTTRAADFASVMNLEVADAAALFQSGLAGETEGLKKFGIDLSAAAVEAYALSSGIWDGTGAMTNAEQVQARYGLLMESTAKTAGDFANTSDGLANSQRIMKANLADAAATIGTALLPILAQLVTFFSTSVIPFLQEYVPKAIDVLATAFNAVKDAIGFVIENIEFFIPVLAGIAIAILASVVPAFIAWATSAGAAAAASIAAAAPFIAVGAAIAAVGVALVWAYQNVDWFRTAVDAVVQWFKTVFIPAMKSVWDGVVAGAKAMAEFFVNTVWPMMQRVWDAIRTGAQALATFFMTYVWPVLQSVWDGIVTGVQAVATFFSGTFLPAVQTVWSAVVEAAQSFWTKTEGLRGFLVDAFNTAITVVGTVIGTLTTAFGVVVEAAQAVWTKTEGLRGFLADAFTVAVNAVKLGLDIWKLAFDAVVAAADAVWTKTESLRSFLSNAFKLGVDIAKLAIDAISNALVWLFGVAQNAWDKTEGLRGFIAGAFKTGIDVGKTAIDAVSTALQAVFGFAQDVWDKTEGVRAFFVGAFKTGIDVAVSAIGTIGGAFQSVIGFLDSIISKAQTAVDWLQRAMGTPQGSIAAGAVFGPAGGSSSGGSSGGAYGKPGSGGGAKADGTNFAPGGRTLVGERGPEYVDLPRGSKVWSSEQSARMGGALVHIGSATFVGRTDADRVAQAVNAALMSRG